MKRYNFLACAALSLLMVGGCTTTGSSSLQREVDALKIEVADLKDNSRLADMRGGASASDAGEISRLRTQVQRLSENVDSTGGMSGLSLRQQLDDISARLDRLEKRAGLRPMDSMAGSAAPVSATGGATAAANDYGGPSVYRGPDENMPAGATQPLAAASPYEDGKTLFDKKQYREAISQFKTYLAGDPEGRNAAAAQFYIGESLYAQKQYEEAILEYQKVVQKFPKSSQIPTSLLKQGLSFQSIGDKDSAKLLYQKVIRDYPKSYAAGVAKERMKTF